MSYLLTLLLIASLVFFGVAQVFRANFESRIETKIEESITTPARPISSEQTPTATSPSPTFHGPVGQPHIIGPSSNPPNY